MRVKPASIISAVNGNQRHELISTSEAMALSRPEKKPTGRSTMPAWTSSGLIMPPEVESSQRQMMTTTTVGTIQVRMTQVRAIFTPGNF